MRTIFDEKTFLQFTTSKFFIKKLNSRQYFSPACYCFLNLLFQNTQHFRIIIFKVSSNLFEEIHQNSPWMSQKIGPTNFLTGNILGFQQLWCYHFIDSYFISESHKRSHASSVVRTNWIFQKMWIDFSKGTIWLFENFSGECTNKFFISLDIVTRKVNYLINTSCSRMQTNEF